ncbi:hypothetical protein KUF57_17825 [Mycolicibacterium sp. PAM1]|uniref:hypothetical protein n=1 Tax=Mycolicibacterium sp. PAM1 TaxID=2853535 RepID=UPI001C3DECC3|nr:hypothetical protein [Mycolicibacterium sp. PAM1]MBV5245404.1 hypothetical protein [Mycolicibacterium sp. PAM1]
MVSSIAAVAIVVVLGIWHLHNRRNPGWLASPDGRFYVSSGYALVAIAGYWLVAAPTATTWEWAAGNAWALVAMVAFVRGFDLLRHVTVAHAEPSQLLESIDAGSPVRTNPSHH